MGKSDVLHDLEEEGAVHGVTIYSKKPSFRNLFRKKLTRERVVPIISANVS
jgi:hypothetical protein